MKFYTCSVLILLVFLSTLAAQQKNTRTREFDENKIFYTLEMNVVQHPDKILIEKPGEIPERFFYFTYTMTNDKGLVVPPSRIRAGEVLAQDVHDIKGVRLFRKGHTVTKDDLLILRRAPHKPIMEDGKRKPPSFFKINDTLTDDVKDFEGHTILKKGTKLDERTRSILLRIPLRPVYVQRKIFPQLDIRMFINHSETMQCLHGCDETFDITDAYPGTEFNCNTPEEKLREMGVRRITKNSVYDGEEGVWGCTRTLYVSGTEYPAIVNKTAAKYIWNNEDKVCHHCHTSFDVLTIKNFKKAEIKCPECGEMNTEDLLIYKPEDKIVCTKCGGNFTAGEVESHVRYQVECPACGQWLKKDFNYVELSYPGILNKEVMGIPFGRTVRGIAIFEGLPRTRDRITVLVSGLTNRYYIQKGKYYFPLTARRLRMGSVSDVRVKSLMLFYKKTGDEFRPDLDFLDYKGKKWVYRSLPVKINRSKRQALELKK